MRVKWACVCTFLLTKSSWFMIRISNTPNDQRQLGKMLNLHKIFIFCSVSKSIPVNNKLLTLAINYLFIPEWRRWCVWLPMCPDMWWQYLEVRGLNIRHRDSENTSRRLSVEFHFLTNMFCLVKFIIVIVLLINLNSWQSLFLK